MKVMESLLLLGGMAAVLVGGYLILDSQEKGLVAKTQEKANLMLAGDIALLAKDMHLSQVRWTPYDDIGILAARVDCLASKDSEVEILEWTDTQTATIKLWLNDAINPGECGYEWVIKLPRSHLRPRKVI